MQLRLTTPFRTGLLVLAFALCAPMAFGQMPQQGNANALSSEDVSDKQLQKAARIAVKAQMSTRQMQMKKRREMKQKYSNPQDMDSTKKAQAKREMMKHQRKVQKKRRMVMQREAKKENMDPKMVQRILMSTRQDSTLEQRFKKAVKTEMKERQPQMGGGNRGGNGMDDGGSLR